MPNCTQHVCVFNPLMGTLIPQSNKPSYSNTATIDGWAVTFGTVRRGLGGLRPAQSPPHCTKCNSPVVAHPSAAGVPGQTGKADRH